MFDFRSLDVILIKQFEQNSIFKVRNDGTEKIILLIDKNKLAKQQGN